MLIKARTLEVDEVVLDLEDAVAGDQKGAARAAAVSALSDGAFVAPRVAVRINAPGTAWCHEDVLALANAPVPPDSLVIPKVEREAELQFVELLIEATQRASGRDSAIRLQALIETAAGVAAVERLAASVPSLEALIVGYADLAASLGRRGAVMPGAWQAIQERILVAARGGHLAAIDGPTLQIDQQDQLLEEVAITRAAGYDGKWAIHPSQIPVITDAFTSTEAERTAARATLEALDASELRGAGATTSGGGMVDEASRRRAAALLTRRD